MPKSLTHASSAHERPSCVLSGVKPRKIDSCRPLRPTLFLGGATVAFLSAAS